MAGKKFHFRLEAVLRLRTHEAEAARKALGLAMQQVASASLEVKRAEYHLHELLTTSSGAQDNLTRLKRIAESRSRALDRLQEKRTRLTAAENVQEEARARLNECLRRLEAMENLKTHQRDAFDQARLRSEQRAMDELSVLGYSRTQQTLTA